MPNFQIVSECNRSCPYCFASDTMSMQQTSDASRYMPMENVERAITFLKKNDKYRWFSIIGGEPTLHPEFSAIVRKVLSGGLGVFVFSNGIFGLRTTEFLASLEDRSIGMMINVNHPSISKPAETKTVERNLSMLGVKASLSYNIYEPDFDLTFLADLIDRYGLKRNVRVGMALPILGKENARISLDDYKTVGTNLVRQAEYLEKKNIYIGMDCGFVLCMFNEQELGSLMRSKADIGFYCKPVVDVGPDLTAWACFPLSNWKKVRIEDFPDFEAIERHFNDNQRLYGQCGALAECLKCRFKDRGQCSAGCLSFTISSFDTGH